MSIAPRTMCARPKPVIPSPILPPTSLPIPVTKAPMLITALLVVVFLFFINTSIHPPYFTLFLLALVFMQKCYTKNEVISVEPALTLEERQQYCSTNKASNMCPPGYCFCSHTGSTQPIEELYTKPDWKKDDSRYADKCD